MQNFCWQLAVYVTFGAVLPYSTTSKANESKASEIRHPFFKVCKNDARSTVNQLLVARLASEYELNVRDCKGIIEAVSRSRKIDLELFGGFSDLNLLRGFPKTEYLDLTHTGVFDLSGIGSIFPNLEVLRLGVNTFQPYSDFRPLAELKSLRVLWADGQTEVQDFSPLFDLPNLELLSLNSANISRIPYLASARLHTLRVRNTKLQDLDFLKKYKSLRLLGISGTGLRKKDVPIPVDKLACDDC